MSKLSIHGMGLGTLQRDASYVFSPQLVEGNRTFYLRDPAGEEEGKARYLLSIDYDNTNKATALSGDKLQFDGETVVFRDGNSILGTPDTIVPVEVETEVPMELREFREYKLYVLFADGRPIHFFLNRQPSEAELKLLERSK
ncbi:MAG: hypothetical protein WC314_23270 [Vulcanimicrobiota bacterium]